HLRAATVRRSGCWFRGSRRIAEVPVRLRHHQDELVRGGWTPRAATENESAVVSALIASGAVRPCRQDRLSIVKARTCTLSHSRTFPRRNLHATSLPPHAINRLRHR